MQQPPMPQPLLSSAVDADMTSMAITDAITDLVKLDFFDRDVIGDHLRMRWSPPVVEQSYQYTIYNGAPDSNAALFEAVEYKSHEKFNEGGTVLERVNIKVFLNERSCYDGHVLEFNLARDHVAAPIVESHGYQPPGIAARFRFDVGEKSIVLAYREPTPGKFCVGWIELGFPAT